MTFARRSFIFAGTLGLILVVPLLFLYDRVGADYPPAITHPEFYYGFVTITIAWQIAFLIIGTEPVRYRPLMLAAMCEKAFYIIAMTLLYLQGRQTFGQFAVTGFDVMFGMLFAISYVKTRRG